MTIPAPVDRFIPTPDVRERFDTLVRAPAGLVMEVAANLDIQSLPLVRTIIRMRERLLGSRAPAPRVVKGLLAETRANGWGVLSQEADRYVVCGATCQPWLADVTFRAIPPDQFAEWPEPGQVKIAWTLESEPLGPALTRFGHETRAVATDAEARRKFLRYWRWARFGIVGIRLLLLPAVRRSAERQWSRQHPTGE